MKRTLYFCFLLLFPVLAYNQDRAFNVSPYFEGITSGKEGLLEAGPELEWDNKLIGKSFLVRPAIRFPLTTANENTLQVDRFSPTWRGVLVMEYGSINNLECVKKDGYSFGLQVEYGLSNFKYYPTADVNNSVNESGSSYAIELKYISFFTMKQLNASQLSPQFRFRYSRNVNPPDPTGVVNSANASGLVTTSEFVLDKPFSTTIVSPAVALQYYPGTGNFSYSPAFFYDFFGAGSNNVSGNSGRIRFELGAFFYPLIKMSYVKFGLTPFVSIRTNGTDNFNAIVYGGQISIRMGTSFLQFF
jgi:hypothetical protein